MKNTHLYLNLFAAISLMASCSNDDNPTGTPTEPIGEETPSSKYIITATPTASEGVADYILTVDDLKEGKISTVGNGIEQDGTYRYYVQNNNKFFSLLYGQGNPGAVTTYELNTEGELEKLSDFQSETVQAFAAVDNDILLIKTARSLDNPIASWYRLDTDLLQFVAEGQINVQDLADKDNGEMAFFSWITQVGNKVYLPYATIKGTSDDRYGTNYPDEANIAVYSYPEMKYEKTITDSRTSAIGRYFTNGLSVDEKGDAYAFSSSIATTINEEGESEFSSTKPSAITRIKSGTTEFDSTYFFDIEEVSGGKYITANMYLGNGNFLVTLLNVSEKGFWSSGKELAIVNVYTKSYMAVTGMPLYENIIDITARNNYVSDDGKTAYVGVTTKTGSYIYNIVVADATATQGLEVEGGKITAISKIEVTVE
ncbi:protein of unknown function [Arenibacter nanhaiticus]|uniref:DUF4374 domain-containing protein n=1 Tax=Arenibacter nanhaiticus TaxID=558155 RepID=A0A1M6BY40_9FLAO|nr:DUF4374 domain-containing protein [Arenibacter nanhaiticus]SHI53702.1 protein of unknown function [Arenibacter nanhaiticus]